MLSLFTRASRRVTSSIIHHPSSTSSSIIRRAGSSGHGHSHTPPAAGSAYPSGVQGDDAFQATGLEKLEIDAEKAGKPLFESVMQGPFGTAANPVLVKSRNAERIVGCPGNCADPTDDGEVMWWMLKKGVDFSCPECAQVFRLVDDGSHAAHH